MSFRSTYEKELAHIRETAKDYAKRYPNIAPFLENHSQDQDVERLIEAFAFMTAKVQQRINDGIPELTQDIFETIWPSFIRARPAMSILQIELDKAPKDGGYVLEKGRIISAEKQQQLLSFKTLFDVGIYPLEINKVRSDIRNAQEIIDIDISLKHGFSLCQLDNIDLAFFLAGNHSNILELNYLLQKKIKDISLFDKDNKQISYVKVSVEDKDICERLGLSATQPDVFELISYYFRFPEIFNYFYCTIKHNQIDNKSSELNKIKSFTLRIVVDLDGMEYIKLNKDNFILYTTPIINCDKVSIAPLHYRGQNHHYRLNIDSAESHHQAISSLNSVSIMGKGDASKQTLSPWNDFPMSSKEAQRLYRLQVRNCPVDGRPIHEIVFEHTLPSEAYIVFDADGFTLNAHEVMGVKDISAQSAVSAEESISYRNITHVTAPIIPHFSHENLWAMIHYMSLRLNKMTTPESFKKLILLFNHMGLHDHSQQRAVTKKVAESIVQVSCETEERFLKRCIVRGSHLILTLNEKNFLNDGDIYLFGSVINVILQSLREVNSYIRLTIIGMERGVTLEWEPCMS